MRIGSSNGGPETSLLTADLDEIPTQTSNGRREMGMSLFGLGADTSIRAAINLERTEVGRGWFGDARMHASKSHRVEFHGAQRLACEGRRAILEGSGCL